MDGQEVSAPTEAGRYRVFAGITDPNYRHSDSADGSPREIGLLEIYGTTPPALYSALFLPGGEDVNGMVPSLPDSIAGTIHFLPGAGDLERLGYQFAGWEYGGKLYSAGAGFTMPAQNVTFTAAWKEASGKIDGSVVWEGEGEPDPEPVEDALVTLMLGSRQIAQAQTAPDGTFSFGKLSPGIYNLVAAYGEIIQTEKVQLTVEEGAQCTIRLPRGKTNSVLEVRDGAPDVVVGNLEKLFGTQPDEVYTAADRQLVKAGGEVEIRMTASDARPEEGSPLDKALQGLGGGFREGITLDLTMSKSRADATGTPVGETQFIHQSSLPLEIVIPLEGEMQNCRNYRVLREHDGAVEEIGTGANQWDEYFVLNEDRTTLTIFAKRFSLYSILWSNAIPDQGGSGSDSGGDDDRDKSYELPEEELPEDEIPAAESAVPAVPETAPEPDGPASSEPMEDSGEPAPSQPAEDGIPVPSQTEPDVPVSAPGGSPFVLLSWAAAAAAVLLALLGKKRGKERLPAALCAAAALIVTLLTGGWNGVVLFTPWTLPVAALALLAGWFARRAGE